MQALLILYTLTSEGIRPEASEVILKNKTFHPKVFVEHFITIWEITDKIQEKNQIKSKSWWLEQSKMSKEMKMTFFKI